ncbi:coiled-coil domain-containing protein 89-like, partial [Anopheles cruzii]|uniref:coiled-coil domain-containing protein 89-like n=1 Tax=Anopheles cruzii TaxID=68878 RepID=UPI0022EC3BB1
LLKLKQQVEHQNQIISKLQRKIREKENMKPKAGSDREEILFLKNRIKKEVELQHKLLKSVATEAHNSANGQPWETIRLCPDKLAEHWCNPWIVGGTVEIEQRGFSCDSNQSPLNGSDLDSDHTADDGNCERLPERIEKELMNRDRVIEILQSRMERLTVDVRKVKRANEEFNIPRTAPGDPESPRFCEADLSRRLEFYRNNTETLGRNLKQMDQALKTIQKELGALEDTPGDVAGCSKSCDRPSNPETVDLSAEDWQTPCHTPAKGGVRHAQQQTTRPSVCPKDAEVRKQYTLLLQEYTKKASECRQLADRLATAKSVPPEDRSTVDAEREMLQTRYSELLDEQDEFRVLLREQTVQLEDYRTKFLDAQTKIEEQKLQMDKLRVTNRRVEQQINFEIGQIKKKFQDKLRELTPYPRLLEDEQVRVEKLKHSNETLFAELERSLKQVKLLEEQLHSLRSSQEGEVQKAVHLLQLELEQLQQQQESLEKEKQTAQQEAGRKQIELDELRTESAKIIARTAQRMEQDRTVAQEKYAQLEHELAQCRAEASFTVANREEALREMHHQIKVLSGSFDDAQLQIQSLRNQLAYLQNEKLLCMV